MNHNIWRRLYIFTPLHHKKDEEINRMFSGQLKTKELPFLRKANLALLMPAPQKTLMGSYLVIGNDSSAICKKTKIIAKNLKSSGFTGKRAKEISEMIYCSEFEFAFGSFEHLMSQSLFYLNGKPIPQRKDTNSSASLNTLLFSYQTWKEITQEIHADFNCWSTPKRHRYVLNTIRHELGLYDELSKTSNGASVALFCDLVIKNMPVLASAVAELKQRKINDGVNIYQDIKARDLTKTEEKQLASVVKSSNEYVEKLMSSK